ncbi:MAG: hypothetical protein NTX50_14920 [Candidatus Sumerlaeota bacterium]|nr:hypothetical protein [Candidatus Sumerlaeota bacterium]
MPRMPWVSRILRSLMLGALALNVTLALPAGAGQDKITLQASPERAGKYEKVEFILVTTGSAQNQNLLDSSQAEMNVEIKTPSGKRLIVPGFLYQPYERKRIARGGRESDWLYPCGQAVWKARFAPMEIGAYEAIAWIKDGPGLVGRVGLVGPVGPVGSARLVGPAESAPARFECVSSARKGFLRISQKDPRFMEFTEGAPFFAIGQNLAFIGETQYVTPLKAEAIFDKLSANGANFLRVWTCCEDWAMALEARKSVWGRSWEKKTLVVAAPDDKAGGQPGGATGGQNRMCLKLSGADGAALPLSPCHPIALRPDTRYAISLDAWMEGDAELQIELNGARLESSSAKKNSWSALKYEFKSGSKDFWIERMSMRLKGAGTAYFNLMSLREAAGGPELLWEAESGVNRPIFGYYNPTDCFMLDGLIEAAEKRGLYLQLCFITRDLYMKMLKKPDSPEYQEAIEHARRLIRYVVARWGYSTSVGAWEYFNEMDPGVPTDRFYDVLGKYFDEIDAAHHLRTTSAWAPSPKDYAHARIDIAEPHFYLRPADKKKIKDEVSAILDRARYVRNLTPSKPALLGEFGLADDQWRACDDMKKDRDYVHFHNALWASALSGLSGTALFWWWDDIDAKNAYRHYRPLSIWLADIPFTTAGLKDATATLSYSQSPAPPADSAVRLIGLQARDQAYLWLLNPQATWADHLDPNAKPSDVSGLTLQVTGLQPGAYKIQWWDTQDGKIIQETNAISTAGVLKTAAPVFNRDIACKIRLPMR